MTPEAQRIAIAEACEYKKPTTPDEPYLDTYGTMNPCYYWQHPTGGPCKGPPNYLNDLNAMHEAEKVLTDAQCKKYSQLLVVVTSAKHNAENYYWHATAAQRAEAFLRTIGKWKDSK